MPLTSYQKKFIKKNAKNLPIGQIADNLGISEKEVRRFSVKHGLKINSESKKNDPVIAVGNFNFKQFFADNIYVFVSLFLLVFICYLNSINNSFVSDDVAGILRNPTIGDWKNIFSGPIRFSPQWCLFILAYKLGGLNPAYFRFANIILHLFSVFSIFTLLSLISRKKIAIFTAIIFAVHPILIESVAWISGMPYSLGALFILLSFIFYILAKDKKYKLAISLAFFILALASSEKVAPFPAILFLYELIFSDLKRSWKKLIPFFSLAFLWGVILIGNIGVRQEALQTQHYQQGGIDNPLIQVPIAIVNYLKLIFWPQNLTLYHTDLTVSWGIYYVILSIFLVFVGAMVYSYKKNKKIFFWLSFFVITLLPTLTPLRISWVVAERYVYLGSIGIFVVVATGLDWLAQKEKIKNYAYTVFAIIILALSVRTILRNIEWKNEDNLWFATAKVSDVGPNIHNNLGDVYTRQGNLEKAAEEFKKAVEINPRYADAMHNLGLTYIQMGKIDEALETFQKAAAMNPNLWQSYQVMASIYFNRGQYELALESMKKAAAINSSDDTLKQNLAVIQNKINEISSAKSP